VTITFIMSHSPNSEYVAHTPMTAAIQSAESIRASDPESKPSKLHKEMEITEKDSASGRRAPSVDSGSMESTYDHTQRKLKPRHIQLIGIGGTIGTALYVQIGNGLRTSGPGSLFIGFSLWLVPPLLNCPLDTFGFLTWVVPAVLLARASMPCGRWAKESKRQRQWISSLRKQDTTKPSSKQNLDSDSISSDPPGCSTLLAQGVYMPLEWTNVDQFAVYATSAHASNDANQPDTQELNPILETLAYLLRISIECPQSYTVF
jgi:hypothetical protein